MVLRNYPQKSSRQNKAQPLRIRRINLMGRPGPVVGGEPTVDTGDWRSQLLPASRQRIVNKILDTLKRHIPFSSQEEGLQELKKIAVRFEEKIYTSATSQPHYLRSISLKMLTMETKSQNTMTDSPPSNSGNNSMNSSDAELWLTLRKAKNRVHQPTPHVGKVLVLRENGDSSGGN